MLTVRLNSVKVLSNVLRDVDDVLPQRDLSNQERKDLDEIARGCHDVLNQLKERLDKNVELDSKVKGISGKSRRIWKRFQWDQTEIDQFRHRVSLNITAFGTFLGRITRFYLSLSPSLCGRKAGAYFPSNVSFATKASVDLLHERQDNRDRQLRHEEHQAIVDWLTSIEYASQQSDFISRRQEGTGQWLLDSAEFHGWLNQKQQTLFCPGIPGAGKTMIASIVVDTLCTRFENNGSIGIAYLYCNFRQQQDQKPAEMLASLLGQLVQGQPSVPKGVKSLYERYKVKRTRPSLNELSEVLLSTAAGYSRTFIVIDALDECGISDGGCKQFLAEVFKIQAKTGASLFATSRFIPDIMEEFKGSPSLEIRAHDGDVRKYLDGHMSQLRSFVSRKPDLQEEIKTEIVKAVDGM